MAITRQDLGHGVGLRPKHFGRFFEGRPPVDWVEATSENFMAPGGRPIAVLEKVRRDVPVVLHGVSLSIGAVDPLNADYLDDLRDLIRRTDPALVSDHLCWGSHGGRYAHDLWPLPYTEEAVAHVVARLAVVQETLGRQILLENISSYGLLPRFNHAGMGISYRRRRAGRLRNPARREQRVRQQQESRV
ncbi:MAG: DUF692 family multinuclear iron-containing protein [Candidatus Binatia bacterium]|jgi:uncharacterized protein (UPF0276 family)